VSRKNCDSGKISSLQDSKLGMENDTSRVNDPQDGLWRSRDNNCLWNRDMKLQEKQKIKRLN
jgi:hypothetical protein